MSFFSVKNTLLNLNDIVCVSSDNKVKGRVIDVSPDGVRVKTLALEPVFVLIPLAANSTVESVQDGEIGRIYLDVRDYVLVRKGSLVRVGKKHPQDESYVLVEPLDTTKASEFAIEASEFAIPHRYIIPIYQEGYFYPGEPVLAHFEDMAVPAKVLTTDTDGVVVEFDKPVGQHSYDGMTGPHRCSIISADKLTRLSK